MLGEILNTIVNNIARAWYMSRLGRILVVVIPAMVVIAVFVQVSGVLKPYVIVFGIWCAAIIVLFVCLLVHLSFPHIKVVFGGGVGGWASTEFGDLPIHDGGYIYGLIVTISNTGGGKLNLETKMVLRDWKTGQSLYATELMPNEPRSRQISDAITGAKHLGFQPYCPQLLELESGDTRKYSLYFFIDKFIVEKLGGDTIGNNIPIPKVANARNDLIFIDRGLNIKFDCQNTGRRNEYKCKRSRLH